MASTFFGYVRRSILVGRLLCFRASRSFHLQGRRVNTAGRYRYKKDVASEPMEDVGLQSGGLQPLSSLSFYLHLLTLIPYR